MPFTSPKIARVNEVAEACVLPNIIASIPGESLHGSMHAPGSSHGRRPRPFPRRLDGHRQGPHTADAYTRDVRPFPVFSVSQWCSSCALRVIAQAEFTTEARSPRRRSRGSAPCSSCLNGAASPLVPSDPPGVRLEGGTRFDAQPILRFIEPRGRAQHV